MSLCESGARERQRVQRRAWLGSCQLSAAQQRVYEAVGAKTKRCKGNKNLWVNITLTVTHFTAISKKIVSCNSVNNFIPTIISINNIILILLAKPGCAYTQKKQKEPKVYDNKFVVSLSVHFCFMTDLTWNWCDRQLCPFQSQPSMALASHSMLWCWHSFGIKPHP